MRLIMYKGDKKISTGFLVNVMFFVAGIMLVSLHDIDNILGWVTRILGVLFVVPSLVYFLMVLVRKSKESQNLLVLGLMPSVGGVFFGVLMMSKPEIFSSVLVILIGVLLCVLGLFRFVYMLVQSRLLKVPFWLYIVPVVVMALGIVVLMVDIVKTNQNYVALIFGVMLIVYPLNSILIYYYSRKSLVKKTMDNITREDKE